MKNLFFFPLILVWVLFTGCRDDELHSENGDNGASYLYSAYKDTEFDNGSSIIFPNINGQLIVDIELLCRIWGFLKYHHPESGKGNYNWDYELFRILPAYLQVKNTEERDRVISDWINKYGLIPVCTTCGDTPSDAYIKPDLLWAENSNMNQTLKVKIKEIYQNRHQGDHYYIRNNDSANNPEFLHENLYNFYYLDAGFRFLTLFRYWNMIHYFFPNKYLTDKNWDNILAEYIPLFITANNRLEFEMATLQLIGEINDTHATFEGGVAIQASRGSYYSPFRVWFIEGKLVVTDYYNPERMDTSDIKIGDIVTHINDVTVESIIEDWKKYYPASNKAAQLRNMSFDMLRSTKNTLNISTSRQAGISIPLYSRSQLNFYGSFKVNSNVKCYKLMDENIGYVTLASITNADVAAIKSAFVNTKGIIIDIRNYPNTSAVFSDSYFISANTLFALFTKGNANNPGEFTFIDGGTVRFTSGLYPGKFAVIVNEITQSHAEFTAMAFRVGNNTTIIGSTTAGADGNVSKINLPGGLQTQISGIGVYYPNGTETQRVGIVPDIWIEPTIEGVRTGRDEPLEMAIHLINKE